MAKLPELRTRDEIQTYLKGVAKEMDMALDSPKVAEELDKRDQLSEFRKKFSVPTIGQLLEESQRDDCTMINSMQ